MSVKRRDAERLKGLEESYRKVEGSKEPLTFGSSFGLISEPNRPIHFGLVRT